LRGDPANNFVVELPTVEINDTEKMTSRKVAMDASWQLKTVDLDPILDSALYTVTPH
jgi:hypothetical protein